MIRPEDLKPWHERWCPAVLPYMAESRCECGGAQREAERRRAEALRRPRT